MAKNASKRINNLETSIRPTKPTPVVVYWRADLGYYQVVGQGVTTKLTVDQYLSLEKRHAIILVHYEKGLRSTVFSEVNNE